MAESSSLTQALQIPSICFFDVIFFNDMTVTNGCVSVDAKMAALIACRSVERDAKLRHLD